MSSADSGKMPRGSSIIPEADQYYINIMRGISILRVVLVHLGLSWFYPPYSQYIGIFLPVLFFVSGAVSYYSFLRAGALAEYLLKRLTLVTVPFYVFALFVILITVIFYRDNVTDAGWLISWLFIWPDFKEVFFPLNQVWFINALVFMIIVSAPFFIISLKRPWVLWLVVAGSFGLSVINAIFPLYEYVTGLSVLVDLRYSHQFWQSLVLLGVFVYGGIHYRYFNGFPDWIYGVAALAFLALAIISFWGFGFEFEMRSHTKNRSVYYLLLAFFAIFLFLALRKPVILLLEKVPGLEWLVLYTNKYAYSVYLLHTLLLFYVERIFGWEDLSDSPAVAFMGSLPFRVESVAS